VSVISFDLVDCGVVVVGFVAQWLVVVVSTSRQRKSEKDVAC
jgi:uncharacterized membrane protein